MSLRLWTVSANNHRLTPTPSTRRQSPATPEVQVISSAFDSSYGQRPLRRWEAGLAFVDRALCNPLTRGLSMARWIHATKSER